MNGQGDEPRGAPRAGGWARRSRLDRGVMGVFMYRLICSVCGDVMKGEVVMPTSLAPGM